MDNVERERDLKKNKKKEARNSQEAKDTVPTSVNNNNVAPSTPTTPRLLGLGPHEVKIKYPVSLPMPTSTSSTTSVDKTDNRDLHTISPEQMADMHREEERLKTFDKWPVPFLTPEKLARNGFYYLGRGDEVRCAFCQVEIMRWIEGDDPAWDHQRWAPQCPFLRRQAGAGNVPLDSPTTAGRDECGTRTPASTTATPLRMPAPMHPQYALEAARLRTFADWPRSMRQKPQELAEAGFFYTGQGDKTKCFYCDGGLKDWENNDIPWEQHARWFDRCPYVQLVKGRDYVQKVITEACVVPPPPKAQSEASTSAPAVEPSSVQSAVVGVSEILEKENESENSVSDEKLCKICYAEERNVCFVPCGHVVSCAKCALSTNKCPMCRKMFSNALRIYFS